MAANTKFFVQPKVRFSQTDTDEVRMKEPKNLTDQKGENADSSKPKIKSIVTLDKPIKLVKVNEACDEQELKDPKITDNIQNIKSSPRTLSPGNNQKSPLLSSNSTSTENQAPLSDADNIQNIKANSKNIDVPKTLSISSNNNMSTNTSATKQDKNSNKAPKFQTYMKVNTLKKDFPKDKKGKENEGVTGKKIGKQPIIKSSNLNASKPKVCSSSVSTKSPNVTSRPSTCATTGKNLKLFKASKSSKPIGLMACHKYSKTPTKPKSPSIKKTLIRDVIGPKIKPCIGPGIQHKRSDVKLPQTDMDTHTKSVVPGEKLARPEYNSIMCTINKLNELKKQKIVTDIEHLPPTYKTLINGKISTALDFPLDEAIYKNLVDLSIDENQLPSRITRSKDPEPRQRDVVPLLSDFFTPTSTEEYCTSVSINPRTPETMDSWNAFRISDQICKWKYILDHV